jgi:hypothetical protein
MTLFVEYYEVRSGDGYEYFFMPINRESVNKADLDSKSHRIWRLNTRTDRIVEIKNVHKDIPPITKPDFFKIQLIAKPLSYSDWYLTKLMVEEFNATKNTK